MAFPTGSIANNTVYKIGNRAWVYNLALGVWDQVADNDTDASNLSGTLGEVTFPAGHCIQVKRINKAVSGDDAWQTFNFSSNAPSVVTVNSSNLEITGVSATSGNILIVTWNHGFLSTSSGNTCLTGIKIGSDPYATGMYQGGTNGAGSGRYAMVSQTSVTLGSSLSNATISAVASSPNQTAASLNWYSYSAGSFNHYPSMTIMEIQQ